MLLIRTIERQCSILSNFISTYISNSCIKPANFFVRCGCEILSKEGTTQDNPISTGSIAHGILPLLHFLLNFILTAELQTKEVAFSDDLAVAGKLENKKFWR